MIGGGYVAKSRREGRLRWVAPAALAIVGAVWTGQGLGLVPGSFMTGRPIWAVLGALLIAGAALLVTRRR